MQAARTLTLLATMMSFPPPMPVIGGRQPLLGSYFELCDAFVQELCREHNS